MYVTVLKQGEKTCLWLSLGLVVQLLDNQGVMFLICHISSSVSSHKLIFLGSSG